MLVHECLRAHDGQPETIIRSGAATHVRYLAHHPCPVATHAIGEFFKPRDNAVITCIQLAKHGWTIGCDIGRATDHGEANTTSCFFFVIEAVAIFWVALFGE